MPNIEKYPAGAFVWVELGTYDQAAAKSFYASLFGWTASDMPMGPGEYYTIFRLDGRDAAAAYTLHPDRSGGAPPHWMPYISVDSTDDSAARAVQIGGKVVAPPLDVFDAGRMAVVQDPTGATFSLWQPKGNPGIGIAGVDGTLCWADLMTTDVARAREFYAVLFGWQIAPGQNDPSGYLHIKNGEAFIGGIPPVGPQTGVPPHWLLYFLATDCDTTVAKAKSLGANIYYGPTTMEGVGRWAVVADPQGAVFAIFQPLPH
ncbi:MAG TPA: VOC family protein [Bryobacteraceae bacterium]|jgi:predicted enzyme related to lactoylglutathione lyase|nr:VOC family protein [Bryobacteraceae bacterium]